MWRSASAAARRAALAELTGGSTTCPYLVDPNTGVQMGESAEIVAYLYDTYGVKRDAPSTAAVTIVTTAARLDACG